LPIFLSIPDFEVGMPVFLAILCLAAVTPISLFQENENPNLPIVKIVYTTIFNSEGGGGNSFKPVTSFPESSTLVEETPIEAVTQAKNFEML
jgi:hypothetical protein